MCQLVRGIQYLVIWSNIILGVFMKVIFGGVCVCVCIRACACMLGDGDGDEGGKRREVLKWGIYQ